MVAAGAGADVEVVAVPDGRLGLAGLDPFPVERLGHARDGGVHADLAPVGAHHVQGVDQVGHLGDDEDPEGDRVAVLGEADAVAVAPGQAGPVQVLVGLGHGVLGVLGAEFPVVELVALVGARLPGLALSGEDRVDDLLPVDGVGEPDTEVLVVVEGTLLLVLVGPVEPDDHRVGGVGFDVDDAVAALAAVAGDDRLVAHRAELVELHVQVAVGDLEDLDLHLLQDLHDDLVDVRQLAAVRVGLPVVGVALADDLAALGGRVPRDPRVEGGHRRVVPRLGDDLHVVDPVGGAGLLRHRVRVLVVLDVELLEVVLGQHHVDARGARDLLKEARLGLLEDVLHGEVVHDLEAGGLSGRGQPQLVHAVLVQLLVGVVVGEGEGEVLHGDRLAVGPLQALAQMEDELLAVVDDFVLLADVGQDLRLGDALPLGRPAHQRLVAQAEPQPADVLRGDHRGVPGAAVDTGLLEGLHHEGCGGETVLDLGQLAGVRLLLQ